MVLAAGWAGMPVQAEQAVQTIQMGGPYSEAPIRVPSRSPVSLHNNGETAIHQTTITQVPSGQRLARIARVAAGQSIHLEFSHEGAYSICFYLKPDSPPAEEKCLYLDVVHQHSARRAGGNFLLRGEPS